MNLAIDPGASHALANAFSQALKHAIGAAALDTVEAAFIEQIAEDYLVDELPEFTTAELAANVADFWTFANERPTREPIIRVARASRLDGEVINRDRLEILQTDSPFLVDSVMAQLAESGLMVRAMFHAVITVTRDAKGRRRKRGTPSRESMIQVVLDPMSEAEAQALIAGVRAALADVAMAVGDHAAMLALVDRSIANLNTAVGHVAPEVLEESATFLRWLRDDRFIFLGARLYDYPRTASGDYAAEEPLYQPEDSLGVLRDPNRMVLRRTNEPAVLSKQLRENLHRSGPLVVAKSNLMSRIHRRVYMDYVGVRRYGADGMAEGEIRFVGLFTSEAYDTPANEIPVVRRKVADVLARAGKAAGGHSDRRLHNILENYPREELFQIEPDDLLTISLGILHLQDRPRTGFFLRFDPFDRFVSVMLFLPREGYDSDVRARAGRILAEGFGGWISAYYPTFSDAPLARVHFIIGVNPGDHLNPDPAVLEAKVAEAVRGWRDRFAASVREASPTREAAADLLARYAGAFPVGYRDIYDSTEAVTDVMVMEAMDPAEPLRVRAFRRENDPVTGFRFKLYRPGQAAPLADVLPILDHMGLKAQAEEGGAIHHLAPDGSARSVWVHEFQLIDAYGDDLAFEDLRAAFEEAIVAVWTGRTENDGFNRLVVELGVSWREAALMRALARYRQQSGLDPSQAVQEAALRDNPGVARLILDLFRTRFDPAIRVDAHARVTQSTLVCQRIGEALQSVESLDADRVLRRLAALTQALTRTNYYQLDAQGEPKPYISFKLAPRELDDLPAPKPFREIFVWSPVVEGVHLRFGPVARGGLRWSDRRDDFRTEVLGLVKAQQVKNAVIVPVGSKGGFFPKLLPRGGSQDAVRAEAVRAYRIFLCGLLDLTDNLGPDGSVVRPAGVIALDADDPYLVVAADKGTATFSDIANGVAEDYGFWLGDAFASGGSAGYDHKAMGITARGAWEAVKRHFRELGKDIQHEPFTVIGVGDMSGDVFGNGMLLSKQIRLIAAFDHRDIFFDPDPDPATSFKERERMFALPRSSWADYNIALISKGGGVFSRTLKSIPLTDEIRALLDIRADHLTPAELINAILKARAELLYLGGVGTYVKAARESNLDVGDKANDAVRVDATQLRCKVVGEGANLGVTQAGRIAFASAGGRIDTDAIDNSAGVDTSDHEVNIKILTGTVERAGKLTRAARDTLLASMTDEVAQHVLAHNIDQTLALSLMEMAAPAEISQHHQFMLDLEAKGRLDRVVEGLPDEAGLAERAAAGKGLTRPELAVLMAYGKLDLFDDIIVGQSPDDPFFEETLKAYFPTGLGVYEDAMQRHRLRREIIATVVDNEIVNRCGPTFPGRLRASAGCDTDALVIGFEAARRILRLDASWSAVAALDGKIPAAAQMALFAELAVVLRGQTFWMARRASHSALALGDDPSKRPAKATVQSLIDTYLPVVDDLRALTPDILSPFEQKSVERRAKGFERAGAPADLAHAVASLRPLTTAADLADLARSAKWPVGAAARLYHGAGAAFGFDQLRAAAGSLATGDGFERLAVRRLIEEMLAEQTQVTGAVMAASKSPKTCADLDGAKAQVKAWAGDHAGPAKALQTTLSDIRKAGDNWSFAKLTIANAALRELAASAR
jgi:glutamate dehydrogenase